MEERDLARELDDLRQVSQYQSSLLVLVMQALDGLASVVRQLPDQSYETRKCLLKADAVKRELHLMPADLHRLTPRSCRPQPHRHEIRELVQVP